MINFPIIISKRLYRILFLIFLITTSIVVIFAFYNSKICVNCNLILISVDTLRADHMGIYGYNKNTTPNIDKWAKKAIIFSNTYTIFPETYQSFYTLFTGTDSVLSNDGYPSQEALNKPTLAEVLNYNNFYTTAFVTNPAVGRDFQIFKKGYYQFTFINKSKEFDSDLLAFKSDYQSSLETTNRTLKWLNDNKNKHFFLWIHYTTPHMPYNPRQKYICQVSKECKDISKYQVFLNEKLPYSTILKGCSNDTPPDKIEDAQTLYDAEIAEADEQVGKILNEIQNLNLHKKSIVVFYGDHGEGFDHNIFGHTAALYQSALHIPFIIYLPQNNKQIFIKNVIDNTNIFPILLDILNLPFNNLTFTGNFIVSAEELIHNNIIKENKLVYSRTTKSTNNKFSIIDGKYKYIYSNSNTCLNNNNQNELYNLYDDPLEEDNIYYKNNDIANRLKGLLFSRFNNEILKNRNLNNKKTESTDIINKLKSLGY